MQISPGETAGQGFNGGYLSSVVIQGGAVFDCLAPPVGTVEHPVGCTNWRDAVIWANALTEYYNAQNGTAWNYASGATLGIANFAATNLVAWFGGVIDGATGNTITTQAVKTKIANALGLFDMSGNVFEMQFDWHPSWIGAERKNSNHEFTARGIAYEQKLLIRSPGSPFSGRGSSECDQCVNSGMV